MFVRRFPRLVACAVTVLIGLCASLSAAPGVRDAPGAGPRKVEVPPLLVGESFSWRFAAVPGFEILSALPEEETRAYASAVVRQRQLLVSLVPEEFLGTWSSPTSVILYGARLERPLPDSVFAAVREKPAVVAGDAAATTPPGEVNVGISPDTWLVGEDGMCVFSTLAQRGRVPATVGLPGVMFLGMMVDRRTPLHPVWLREGLLHFYSEIAIDGDGLTAAPATWISRTETELFRIDKKFPLTLVPLGEVFARTNLSPEGWDLHKRQTAASQMALLLRWTYDPRGGNRPGAFWTFAKAAIADVAGENLFRAHFGRGYGEMDAELKTYLRSAIKSPLPLVSGRSGNPGVEVRAATPVEVARVKAEWARQAARQVALTEPRVRRVYLDAGVAELKRVPEAGTDARLLATAGLLAIERDDETEALVKLEMAAVAGTEIRPQALVDLARLRLKRARADRTRDGGNAGGESGARLGDDVLQPIMALLARARAQQPQIAGGYQILAEALAVATGSAAIAPDDLATLLRGTKFFPANWELAIAVGASLKDRGHLAEASAVVAFSLENTKDETGRRRLLGLRSAISAAARKP